MKKNNMLPVKNSITTQLLKVIFFFYIIVTIVMTIVHMSAEFNSTKKAVEHELRVIGNTFAPALARALWDMNVEQLNPTFLGMVESPTVVGMMIKNEKGIDCYLIGGEKDCVNMHSHNQHAVCLTSEESA